MLACQRRIAETRIRGSPIRLAEAPLAAPISARAGFARTRV
jgi:hypothetical protein